MIASSVHPHAAVSHSILQNDEVYIEYAVKLLHVVGQTYMRRRSGGPQANREDPVGKVIQHLCSVKHKLSKRMRFMIMDLE